MESIPHGYVCSRSIACITTKFYAMDSGYIYYQRGFGDGNLDPQIAIYRDAEDGPCGICMLQKEVWKDKVIDKILIKDAKLLFKVGF